MDINAPPPDDTQLRAMLAELIDRAEQAAPEVRRAAFEQIYELAYKVHAKAAPAIPALIGGLVDPDPKIGESSLWALQYCAPESIEPLIECLSHPAALVRERAAQALGNVGDDARPAGPELRELLHDAQQAVRRRAAWALGLVHDSHPETVLRLVRMVTDGSSDDREAALHALGNIGRGADTPAFLASYRSQILAALDSPEKDVRRWALYAAESVGLDVQAWADLLVSVVQRDESSDVRSAALSTLKPLAPLVDLAAAVPVLTSRLAGPGAETAAVCEILGAMRPAPAQAIPLLHEALGRDEWALPVATALWRIEGRAESILPAMRRMFDDNGEGVCDLICEMGPAAAPLLPDVIKALAGEDYWDLQWAAADALRAIASTDPAVLGPLLDALAHPSPIVKSASARALAAGGVAALAALKALKALLSDPADPRAAWAAYALGEMGPVAAEALAGLRAGMREGGEPLASSCAIAVARIAADAECVPYLVTVLRSEDPHAPRRAAALALAEIGPAASQAATALEALVDNADWDTAEAAMQALSSIQGAPH